MSPLRQCLKWSTGSHWLLCFRSGTCYSWHENPTCQSGSIVQIASDSTWWPQRCWMGISKLCVWSPYKVPTVLGQKKWLLSFCHLFVSHRLDLLQTSFSPARVPITSPAVIPSGSAPGGQELWLICQCLDDSRLMKVWEDGQASLITCEQSWLLSLHTPSTTSAWLPFWKWLDSEQCPCLNNPALCCFKDPSTKAAHNWIYKEADAPGSGTSLKRFVYKTKRKCNILL